ncbi:TPA: host cell division inhibitor Icd-like protein [Klebsiella pneumoniae]|uniref:host cell division inhibitor Icd-like protein n=1 Tax=Klebsiella quasipneumoniae TaxID=1463165 RepID=UPI0015E8D433|nr:host cell division inhibitor Icd-like protein [Klebsiella quasipneumoniae]EKZ9998772.1 host cell division inhibitor Icd-like protein [Klebsiella pneumoniae]HBU8750152.1 host cell division inhibitor Icd-like protein [Klebsiella pneumoniae]HBW4998642.1 host cell division inhibitor Icd-like protein [Klebsiella pneumoniae]HBW5335217.1 host cell division inhibitor Icd-like protein [Klebsiella pneumoniae]HBW5633241.1 host cell division inhibitor Icd-like protein [Klebsiella pneumoniae]
MAGSQHTQTHPKFQYFFDALKRNDMAAGVARISVEADSLVEARQKIKKNYVAAFTRGRKSAQPSRLKFTWRFLSISERFPDAKPLVIYVNASSEQEARDTMPGVNLIFAARLPFHAFPIFEVCHE